MVKMLGRKHIFRRWKSLSKSTKKQILVIAAICLLASGYLLWDISFSGPLTSLFNNREAIIELVQKRLVLGPLIYVALQITQTVVAPIPGGAVGPIGGFLFGWWGVLWTTIGSTLGAWAVFLISKKYGRALLLKIFKKEEIEKFDMIPQERSEMLIFALFLIPGLPDDTICYLAGLTKVPTKRLLICWMIGRLPAVIVANYLGMGIGTGNITGSLVVLGITALILGFVAIEKDKILALLREKR